MPSCSRLSRSMRFSPVRWVGQWRRRRCWPRRSGLAVVVFEELSEVDHGGFAGLTGAEIEAAYPGQLAVRERDGYRYRFPGGESYAVADLRVRRVLAAIARTGARRPLLVSHEMLGRMLLKNSPGSAARMRCGWGIPGRLCTGWCQGGRVSSGCDVLAPAEGCCVDAHTMGAWCPGPVRRMLPLLSTSNGFSCNRYQPTHVLGPVVASVFLLFVSGPVGVEIAVRA